MNNFEKEQLLNDVNALITKLEIDGDKSYRLLTEFNSIIEKYDKIIKRNESHISFLKKYCQEKIAENDLFSVKLQEIECTSNYSVEVNAIFKHIEFPQSTPDIEVNFYVDIEVTDDMLEYFDEHDMLSPEDRLNIEIRINHEANNSFKFENFEKLDINKYQLVSYDIDTYTNKFGINSYKLV
jgi:hypothetical protein